jgi:hypothetical protein
MLIAQSLGKCSNLEILAEVEIKESNFFLNIGQGFDLGKKVETISCLCIFN